MRDLIKNIWEAPMSTVAGGITAGLAYVLGTDVVELPGPVVLVVGALAAFLAVFDGPNAGGS